MVRCRREANKEEGSVGKNGKQIAMTAARKARVDRVLDKLAVVEIRVERDLSQADMIAQRDKFSDLRVKVARFGVAAYELRKLMDRPDHMLSRGAMLGKAAAVRRAALEIELVLQDDKNFLINE